MTFVICVFGVNAQNTKVITGAVIDNNGNPLPNALVEATGGAENVTTDADGSFRIEVPIWLKSLTAKYGGLNDKKIKLKRKDQILIEMKPVTGHWFLDAAYSINFGDFTFNRAGLMGGYLGEWGGYAKVMIPFGGGNGGKETGVEQKVPSVTAGVIKQVSSPLYLYLGAGYSPVWGHLYHYYSSHTVCYSYNEAGGMFEAGAILKFGKVNFNVGYSFSSSFCSYTNHSIQLSVGYCF
jgi:hypothetical protein